MSDVDGRFWDREPETRRPRDVPGSIDGAYIALAALRTQEKRAEWERHNVGPGPDVPPRRSIWRHLLGVVTWPFWRKLVAVAVLLAASGAEAAYLAGHECLATQSMDLYGTAISSDPVRCPPSSSTNHFASALRRPEWVEYASEGTTGQTAGFTFSTPFSYVSSPPPLMNPTFSLPPNGMAPGRSHGGHGGGHGKGGHSGGHSGGHGGHGGKK
jgi:hypothetical protein